MILQIVGTRSDPGTRKAERFFRDRGIEYHFVELRERGLSRGEIENIGRALGGQELIDRDSAEFRRLGMAHLDVDPIDALVEHPLLTRIPIVRNGKEATVGEAKERWQLWVAAERHRR